jgi:hypothetical protein
MLACDLSETWFMQQQRRSRGCLSPSASSAYQCPGDGLSRLRLQPCAAARVAFAFSNLNPQCCTRVYPYYGSNIWQKWERPVSVQLLTNKWTLFSKKNQENAECVRTGTSKRYCPQRCSARGARAERRHRCSRTGVSPRAFPLYT